jgi:hypothetical protein
MICASRARLTFIMDTVYRLHGIEFEWLQEKARRTLTNMEFSLKKARRYFWSILPNG